MDLYEYILQSQCECLNERDDHPLRNCLTQDDTFLLSDCDEQVTTDNYTKENYILIRILI